MGCSQNKTLDEEFVERFYSSLPIKKLEVMKVATKLVEIKAKNAFEDAIVKIQQDLYESTDPQFATIKLFSSFYNDTTELKIKYDNFEYEVAMFLSILLFCKQHNLYHQDLADAICLILESFGIKKKNFFDIDYRCDKVIILLMLNIYMELATSYGISLLSNVIEGDKSEFENKFSDCYSKENLNFFIQNHIKVDHDKISFKFFIYMWEEFEDTKIRERLVEKYNAILKIQDDDKKKSIKIRDNIVAKSSSNNIRLQNN